MEDHLVTKGQPKYSLPTAGKAPVIPMPVFGIVKNNIDPTRQGKIEVYIPEGTATNPENSKNWRVVAPLGFYGKTLGDAPSTGYGSFKTNPISYGEWHSPPDIGTKVVCVFVNGDPNYGYYIGGVYDPTALQMVPAIGATENVTMNPGEAKSYGGAVRLPVTNINNKSPETATASKYLDAAKPVHSYTASVLNQQGLLRDPIRGAISSSAQRESLSRVGYGVSTPGRPIYQGGFDDTTIAAELKKSNKPLSSYKIVARRTGHSFVMDDGDVVGRDQLIRLRSAGGHQITMSDDGQTLFIIHSNGQSYIELGKEGTVDIYSTNSFNVRTQGDLNLHADRDVNIHAENMINMRGMKGINVQSDGPYKLKVLQDYAESIIGNLTSLIGKAYAVSAGGQASMVAAAEAFVNGSKVNLNSGDSATQPSEVDDLTAFVQTDTLFDADKGFIAAPGKLLSITTRAPAHAPWANAGQGVDVQTNLGASANLPPSPSEAVADANTAAAADTEVQTPSQTASAVQPSGSGEGGSLNQNATSMMGGSVGQDVAKNPLTAAAAAKGAGVIKLPGG